MFCSFFPINYPSLTIETDFNEQERMDIMNKRKVVQLGLLSLTTEKSN